MKYKSKPTFGDDRAKSNPWREDKLGVAPLAHRLARVIRSLEAPSGYVIGVNGVWGHGKSTLLNFTRAYLDKYNEEAGDDDDKIHIIDFRPWMVSGHQDLVSAFFKVLSESLGPREHKIKRLWRKALKQFGGSSDAIMDAMAKVAVAIDIGGSKGAATFLVNVAKRPIKDKITEFLKDESLQSAHARLVKQLETANERILVTIDDIDRLSAEEVTSIMQMVKTVGQLPNVIYLLSYDRSKISEAFKESTTDGSPRYSEKIIQHEIDLPKPSKSALLLILEKEISFLLKATNLEKRRWSTIVTSGITRWIEKPRDVLRLANAVKFSWPALEGEIDPIDLLTMEGLRLFDTSSFNWIRDNRNFLFPNGRYQFLDKSASRQFVEQFVESLSQRDDKVDVLKIIDVLFTGFGDFVKEKSLYHSEPYHSVIKRRGMASEAGYDAYFALNPSPDAIPKRVLDDFLSGKNSEAQLVSVISSCLGKRDSSGDAMIGEFLGELQYRFDAPGPPEINQPLVNALFSQADKIFSEPDSNSTLKLSPTLKLLNLVRQMLQMVDGTDAAQLLRTVYSGTSSLALCISVYLDLGRTLSVFPLEGDSPTRAPIIESDLFEELGTLLFERIKEAAVDGSLRAAPFFRNSIEVWSHFDKGSEPKIWTNRSMMVDVAFLLNVASGFVDFHSSSSGRSYFFSADSTLQERYDLDAICSATRKHLAMDGLNTDSRQQLLVLLTGMKKLVDKAGATNGSDV